VVCGRATAAIVESLTTMASMMTSVVLFTVNVKDVVLF